MKNREYTVWRTILAVVLLIGYIESVSTQPQGGATNQSERITNATNDAALANSSAAQQRDRKRYATVYPSDINLPLPARPSFSPGQPTEPRSPPPPPLATSRQSPDEIEIDIRHPAGHHELHPGPLFRGVDDEENDQPIGNPYLASSSYDRAETSSTSTRHQSPTVIDSDLRSAVNYDDGFEPKSNYGTTSTNAPPIYISPSVSPPPVVSTSFPVGSTSHPVDPYSLPVGQQSLQSSQSLPNQLPATRYNTSPRSESYSSSESPSSESNERFLPRQFESDSISIDNQEVAPLSTATMDMPLIEAVQLQCSMTSMQVTLEFDRPFGGVVYSRGHFDDPRCHYVPFGTNRRSFVFEVAVNRCGARFVDSDTATDGGGGGGDALPSALEDELVFQNEPSIQEMWDTARHIRCTWSGTLRRTVQSGLKVDTLNTEAVSRNADTAEAVLDVQLGRGPFAESLSDRTTVEIGDTLTLVVAVSGGGVDDVLVRECVGRDSAGHSVTLTDADGCVLKPKLLSSWRTTRDTGRTGAAILAYAYLQAFKFPDRMEVQLECSLDICKRKCRPRICKNGRDDDFIVDGYGRQTGLGRRRRRESVMKYRSNGSLSPTTQDDDEQMILHKTLRVVSRDDALVRKSSNGTAASSVVVVAAPPPVASPPSLAQSNDVCFSLTGFVISVVIMFVVTVVAACAVTAVICLRRVTSLAEVQRSRAMMTPPTIGRAGGASVSSALTHKEFLCNLVKD